jgi:uncharacterized protein YqfA (UPF0365 family)
MLQGAVGATSLVWVVAAACILVLLLVFALFGSLMSHWLMAHAAGVHIPMTSLIGIRLRRVPIKPMVESYIQLKQAKMDVELDALERHHLSGGRVPRVANWLVAAKASGLSVPVDEPCRLDLAGKLPDVRDATEADPSRLAATLGSRMN